MPQNQKDQEAKRAFTHGTSGSTADLAADPKCDIDEQRYVEVAPTRPAEPAGEGKIDHLAERQAKAEDRQEALLDEAVEETFPSSDPISPKHIT